MPIAVPNLRSTARFWLIGLSAPVLLYIVPALYSATCLAQRSIFSVSWVEGFWPSVIRTWLLSVGSTFLSTILALLGASSLSTRLPVGQRLLPILMLPTLLGSTAYGFAAKLGVADSRFLQATISERKFIVTWAMMLGLQVAQIMPLYLYLFWLRLSSSPEDRLRILLAAGANRSECLRDVLWPHVRPLAIVLIVFGILLGLQETAKVGLALSPSIATHCQLIGHWLSRLYTAQQSTNILQAQEIVLGWSLFVLLMNLFFALVSALVIVRLCDMLVRIIPQTPLRHIIGSFGLRLVVVGLSSAAVFLPIGCVLRHTNAHSGQIFAPAARHAILAFGASLSLTLIAIFFAFWARVGLRFLTAPNARSISFLVLIGLLQVIPPIGLTVATGVIFGAADVTNRYTFLFAWLYGVVTLFFPIISAFLIWRFWSVPDEELALAHIYGFKARELLQFSFSRRFMTDIALLLIFAFALVWTEHTISLHCSVWMPTVANELASRVNGRGTSFGEASNLIVVLALPILLLTALSAYFSRRVLRMRLATESVGGLA